MPTFYDPVADAEEASEALRGLAHASRTFDHPEDAYAVIGDLRATARRFEQVLDQLARVHADHHGRAFDDHGDQAAGIRDADLTAVELSRAARVMGLAEERLDAAMQAAGRIAWQPAPEPPGQVTTAGRDGGPEVVSRWVNIVFLQGEEADTVLDLIDRHGLDAAIEHLSGYDDGVETTDAAMENGYVYDAVPTGRLGKEAVSGEYTMTYNPDMGHVGLYRRHQIPPDDRLDTPAPGAVGPAVGGAAGVAGTAGGLAAGAGGATGAAASRSTRALRTSDAATGGRKTPTPAAKKRPAKTDGSWFTHPGVAAVKRDRGLGL